MFCLASYLKAQLRKERSRSKLPFTVIDGALYRSSYQGDLLKFVCGEEVDYVLREICEGCCADHIGGISLSRKAQLAGFWWPTMNSDATRMERSCEGCQRYGNFLHNPLSSLKTIPVSCLLINGVWRLCGLYQSSGRKRNFSL